MIGYKILMQKVSEGVYTIERWYVDDVGDDIVVIALKSGLQFELLVLGKPKE